MKRSGLYVAALTIALTGGYAFSSQAAVRMIVIGGNCFSGENTCGSRMNGNTNVGQFFNDYFANCPNNNWSNTLPEWNDFSEYFPNQNWQNGNSPSQNWSEQNQPDQKEPSAEYNENASFVQQVIDLVNTERANAGLSPLKESAQASKAALVRAKEISQSFSHTRPDGSSFSTVLQQNGITFRASGENIAYGQRTPQEVMNSWMNSQGHRANILNPNFTSIGVGYYQDSQGTGYWTQLFVQ